jgi:hypothetical protein
LFLCTMVAIASFLLRKSAIIFFSVVKTKFSPLRMASTFYHILSTPIFATMCKYNVKHQHFLEAQNGKSNPLRRILRIVMKSI